MSLKHILIMALLGLAFAGCAKQQQPPPPGAGMSPAELLRHNTCLVNPTAPGCF